MADGATKYGGEGGSRKLRRVGGRDGRPAGDGQCPGGRTGGSTPCAAGAKAELPAQSRRVARGRVAPAPPSAPPSHLARSRYGEGHAPDGARGALRAL